MNLRGDRLRFIIETRAHYSKPYHRVLPVVQGVARKVKLFSQAARGFHWNVLGTQK